MSFTNLQPSSVNTAATFTFANVTVTNTSSLGDVGNVKITGGSSGQAVITDGAGNLSFTSVSTTPTGSNTQIAYNNAGTYGTSANFTFTNTTNTLNVDNIVANGAGITYITASNISGQVANALIAGNVYNAAQPNITSTGTLTGLTVSGTTNLGAVTNVRITGGLTNQVLTTDGLGNLSWAAGAGGGSSGGAGFITVTKDVFTATGSANTYTISISPSSAAYLVVNIDGIVQQLSSYSLSGNSVTISGMPAAGEIIEVTSYGVGGLPGGSNTEVQFNDNGVFQGAPTFTFNGATGTVAATNFTGNLTTGAQPNITSVGALTNLNTGDFTATGWTTLQESTDVLTTKTGATGTVTHDVSTGAIFYHSSIAGNFTANFTNVSTTDNRSIVFTLILAQGATPYYATACQVDGVSQTIKWPSATAPTATASRTEFQNFVFIRVGSAWVVTSSLASFG